MEDTRATALLKELEKARTARCSWEQHWQDIREYVRPVGMDFNRQSAKGNRRTQLIFDGTAVNANEELASGLQSFLTNPVERWFEIQTEDMGEIRDMFEGQLWLEMVSDLIYNEYSRPDTGLNQALSEVYSDLSSYGTSVIYQDWSNGHLRFRSFSLASCFLKEGANGKVDTCYRITKMSTRNVLQEFGRVHHRINDEKDQEKEWTVAHMVFPQTDRLTFGYGPTNKKYASVWVCEETKSIFKESGYRTFCYHCPRWSKLPDEVYGRSPAMTCLPDIKMVNAIERVLIKAAQKIVDPPLMVPSDGFLLPIETSPGSLIFKEPGMTETIEPLLIQGDLPVGMELSNQKRDQIRRAFHSDWLRMEKENKEMTAYEVADRRDEKLRLLAPSLGRIQSELLGPMIERSYELLDFYGYVPQAPGPMLGMLLKVEYVSPASRAQLGAKIIQLGRYIQDLAPAAQIQPDVFDIVDFDEWARQLATARGVSMRVLKSPSRMKQMRDEKQASQELQTAAAIAEPASKAIKNVADAQKLLGSGGMM